jgi:hypothetical protein
MASVSTLVLTLSYSFLIRYYYQIDCPEDRESQKKQKNR